MLDMWERSVGQKNIALVNFLLFFFCFNSNFFAGQITNVEAGADSTAFNAQTFAHELGHNLGMR